MKKIFLLLLILVKVDLFCQILVVYDISLTEFPIVKGNFFAFDNNLLQITNLDTYDFLVMEDGLERNVTFVSCPPPKAPQSLSSVLTIDISGSMEGNNLILAKEAAKIWIESLPLKQSECAVTSFNNSNYLNQDYTNDKDKLLKVLTTLNPFDGTNFDAGLFRPMAGGIHVAKRGKNKKCILFLTDGEGSGSENEIIDEAIKNNITIYTVVLENRAGEFLKNIALKTGGMWYENIFTTEKIKEVYKLILAVEQEVIPCSIEWESTPGCDSLQTDVSVSLLRNGATSNFLYKIPQNGLSSLNTEPSSVYFRNIAIGTQADTIIKITAQNSSYDILNITSSDPAFSIDPAAFSLGMGESKNITLSYNPTDSAYRYTKINIENNICPAKLMAAGGYSNIPPKVRTLKLLMPNGGESFVVGADTIISWDGVLPTDPVTLDFSTNNGLNWIPLANDVRALNYKWQVPDNPSDKCLARVRTAPYGPEIEWQKSFGGSKSDEAKRILETEDGGFLVCGVANSNDGDVKNHGAESDCWLIKLDPAGNIEWQKCYGGSAKDIPYDIVGTKDGSFIIAGETTSNDGAVSGNHSSRSDFWLLKLDKQGYIEWKKCYGGSYNEGATSIDLTSDGGYIVTGWSESVDGDINENEGSMDFWIIKINDKGVLEWQRVYGGRGDDKPSVIKQNPDGSYIIAGSTNSNNADVSFNHGSNDFWLVKLDNNGFIVWQKTYGGISRDIAYSLIQLQDGGYQIAGYSGSQDGDIKGNHGFYDAWVLKIDSIGTLEWQKCFGGKDYDEIYSMNRTSDYGFILTGSSASHDGDVVNDSLVKSSFWIIKLNNFGEMEWNKTIPGNMRGMSICETSQGAYIAAGSSLNNSQGLFDYFVVKLAPGSILSQTDSSDSVWSIVKPEAISKDIDMGIVLTGISKDSLIKDFLINPGSFDIRVDSILITGTHAPEYEMISGFPPFKIAPKNEKQVEFRFKPLFTGIRSASIEIYTQSGSFTQSISGEGVSPQIKIINEYIDFGLVTIGGFKDTIQAVTITNIGSAKIDNIIAKHELPNDVDFTTISGSVPFSLEPGDTAKMDLRFTPGFVGLTNGILNFYFKETGSPATVQLFGEGVKKYPSILTNILEFPVILCEDSTESILSIQNNGGDTLFIYEVNLKGLNSEDFNIDFTKPFFIESDSIRNISISFKPKSTGFKNADIEIKSNADPDSLLILNISARKDTISLLPDTNFIDLGILCPGESKDSTISIFNKGTINTGLYASVSGNILINEKEFTIETSNSYKLDFRFTGIQDEGDFNEKITVTDSICNYSFDIMIRGRIHSPKIIISEPDLVSMIGSNRIGLIRIENISDRNIEIQKLPTINYPFELLNVTFPLLITANRFVELSVRYIPDDNINDTLLISFNYEPCIMSDSIKLLGIPVNVKAVLKAGNTEGKPGDIVEVPIYLIDTLNILESGISGLLCDLSYNSTILLPFNLLTASNLKESHLNTITTETGKGKIHLDLALSDYKDSLLAIIQCFAGLGNAIESDLIISNLSAVNGTIDLSKIDGKFILKGICEEGGTRLFNPYGNVSISAVNPNPVKDEIEIKINLIEKGSTKLYITNYLGNQIINIYDGNIFKVGEYSFNISVENISSGLYFLVLETNTVRKSVKIIIEK